MSLFKKSVSKEFLPLSESPIWGTGSVVYATLKR